MKIKLSNYKPDAQAKMKRNMATIQVGDRVRYVGDSEWTRQQGTFNREGVVVRKIKTRWEIAIQWDVPLGPLEYQIVFYAHAFNVEHVA